MPDVALYLTYVARWLQKREIISGPATREETEYGRKYLESEMRNNRGIFAEPPTSRHQIIPSKYRPPPDSKRPTWSMIAEDKELQERIRDKDDDISLGYYINDECRLVREDQEEAFVKTNIRVPFPRIMKYPLSDEYLSKTVSLMYESKINPCWRCLESLDWDGDWEFYADWMEDVFMLHRFGQKVEVEKPAVIESSTMPPPPQLLPIKEYDHLIAPLGSA
ncbi:hypothetical protein I302_108749 [Kwoniella bestiolae CBS 10118]|uniref:Uncharacterized protein n=1 Tax=Kwoniella bestiolae CBS 10118 TaxID=1296100 RepID=A0A1B9FU10_9TREE|nr:hypothetical protein I302_07886 [Kwoniella bestiolae CBS 10118]OCF22241.1 hypothetical protein I302_07886 [Kwoniella bestiolae CBS 10118]